MAQYPSIMPQYAMKCFYISQYANIANVAEYSWKNCCDNDRVLNMLQYATVLNMTGYSYNNILIVVTNATTLEFLPAWFLHLGA